jgi:DNA polymerase-3 subunit alpha
MAQHPPFVHLHLHTEYSMLDGAVRTDALMARAVEYGMPAVAMTDHGNLHGAIEFYQAAKKAGVKPIIGCEVYMAPGLHTDRQANSARDAAYHFTLLAKDFTGYRNLVKLVSKGHLDGFYYKPRIDKALLAEHAAGLIGLSGCLKGEINMAIQADQIAKARNGIAEFRDILGRENFFVELHDHNLEAQQRCNRVLPGLAREFGLGLVAANDVHFLDRSHHEAHDVMICIGTGAMVHDEKRMRYVPELYFKSPAEMHALFGELPESLANTVAIAERCNLEIDFASGKYPRFPPPAGKTEEEFLREICEAGVRARYGERAEEDPVIRERLNYEIDVLVRTKFVSYFLIVWDFIRFAKERGIPVGPGRGSAAGSMVAYVMNITDIDPLRFGLLFERFLNPERVSPPDIDVDFCVARRGEVIDYVRQKYGERAVAQIVTFGTLGAKSVVRDVGRVLGWSYGDADRIARMIPVALNMTLNGVDKVNPATGEKKHEPGAIDLNPELKQAVENEPNTRQLWEYATFLEGLTRGTGVHAAGVVISDRDLTEYIPLMRSNESEVISQYAMGPLTDLGLLKMDFLGLKNLTVIDDALHLIHKRQPDFAMADVPLDDQAAFALLNRGETVGVFQVESGGMTNVCRQIEISRIEDIIALIALYRPGPMDLIPNYIKRKKGEIKIKYEHPLLEEVCAETYGVMIYQEQVMAAASKLAGYSLGDADLLRRAMGKKDREKMAKERERFIRGCAEKNGIAEKKANAIFDLLEKFAGYGFNKSHSAAYGVICYHTAYLKANHPVEFMAALLSNEINNTAKIAGLVADCRRMGIEILPPDVNRSGLKFAPEKSGDADAIRFGLAAIKNVGEGAMEAAVEERKRNGDYRSLEDFCARVDSRKVNKKVLESLTKAGAFDFTGVHRAQLFFGIENALSASAASHRDRAAGQTSLFGEVAVEPAMSVRFPPVTPWSAAEKLGYEKELLGFYVTGHPLDEFRSVLESGRYVPVAELRGGEDREVMHVAGVLSNVIKRFTKKDGKPFATATLEDLTGSIEVKIWSEAYSKCAGCLDSPGAVSVTGKLDRREETPQLVVSELGSLKAPKPSVGNEPVVLRFELGRTREDDLLAVKAAVERFPGQRPLMIEFSRAGAGSVRLRSGEAFRVDWAPELQRELDRLGCRGRL